MTDQKDICPDVFGDDAPKTPPEKTKGDSQAPPQPAANGFLLILM
jgi:hypothetical protein